MGQPGAYTLFETKTRADFTALAARVRSGELHGLNVTTPWKSVAAMVCDRVLICDERGELLTTPTDERRTPVNTLFMRDGTLCGTSTDGPGLGLALTRAAVTLRGRPIAILGAGGAGASIAHWLVAMGADVRWISNRSMEPARALAARLTTTPAPTVVPWLAPAAMAEAEVVVHTSKVGHGLVGAQAEAASAHLAHLPWAEWASRAVLVDVVYGAERTAAERCAARAGGRWVEESGYAMLACQAALSLGIWADAIAPVDAMLAALTATP